MEPRGEASGTRGENHIVVAGQNKSHGEASSPNHGPAEHSQSNRALGRSGGNHRTHHSGHHNRQPRDPAAVTSKPHHPPQADVVELACGKSVALAQLAQGAGQGAQGHHPACSHMSQRFGEHVDPPKDDARHRLNLLADSKFDEEESSAGPVCFGPRIHNEPFSAKFTLPRDMPKYTGAGRLAVRLRHSRRHRGRQQEDSGALRTTHTDGICPDVAQQPAGSTDQFLA
jgi:hypothetical protein